MALLLVLAYGVVFACCLFAMLLKWNDIRYRRKGLPPGTMGWPLFGETLQFLKYGPDFMKTQKARYGNLFKTHILGCPTVISMDPEVNRYILVNEGKGLVPGYPKSMLDIMGRANIAAVPPSIHKYVRGSLLSLIGPPMIKDLILLKVDNSVRHFLANWEGKILDIQERAKEFAFFASFQHIFEAESSPPYTTFKKEFDKMAYGALSLPINIPGTLYRNGVQGRKEIIKMLKQVIKDRRASSTDYNDSLGQLLQDEDSKYHLNDEEIFDQISTMLYSGYETVSVTLMMTIKYLHDHPKVLQELREEHMAIRTKKTPDEAIDWEDYKTMTFTRSVILETSRLATVVNGVLRKTTRDIELEGFIIPKGWRVYVYTREINYDPKFYSEPLTFNPWRWLGKNIENRNHCFLFGAGTRLCPGKELGIAKICTFLHYFVTKYRWEEIGRGGNFTKFPRVEAPNGLYLRIDKY